MVIFELLIALSLAGALLAGLAQKVGAPYPSILALAGIVLALIPPDIPHPALEPDLVLVLFVAPALLDAAFDISLRDLRENWLPVTSLVLVAVGLTVAAVAVVARLLVPDMGWAAAVTLGAIVAPPDAVAASLVLRQISPPHRLLVVLEGEGLLNDVSALLIYRLALGVAMGGSVSLASAAPILLASSVGSVIAGYGLARLYLVLTRRIDDLSISVVSQFVGTFAVWILADRAGLSPILTLVVYAITIAQIAPYRQAPENRRGSYAVWEVVVFALNALAFILIGLQLQEIAKHHDGALLPTLGFDAAVLGTVIGVRLAWVATFALLARGTRRLLRERLGRRPYAPSLKSVLVVGWSGMRGPITLATALALPAADAAGQGGFPHRDLVLTAAYAVVVGTLLLQGLTLGPLLRWLDLSDDQTVEKERAMARREAVRAALTVLEGLQEPEATILRKEYALLAEDENRRPSLRPDVFGRLRMRAIAAERGALRRLRQSREIGDDAFHAIEEELDWAEGHARRRVEALTSVTPGSD